MEFTCGFSMDNAAFEDDPEEAGRILQKLANDMKYMMRPLVAKNQPWHGSLLDINGNFVGAWEIRDTGDDE